MSKNPLQRIYDTMKTGLWDSLKLPASANLCLFNWANRWLFSQSCPKGEFLPLSEVENNSNLFACRGNGQNFVIQKVKKVHPFPIRLGKRKCDVYLNVCTLTTIYCRTGNFRDTKISRLSPKSNFPGRWEVRTWCDVTPWYVMSLWKSFMGEYWQRGHDAGGRISAQVFSFALQQA